MAAKVASGKLSLLSNEALGIETAGIPVSALAAGFHLEATYLLLYLLAFTFGAGHLGLVMFGNSLDQGKRLFTLFTPVLIRCHRLSSFKISLEIT